MKPIRSRKRKEKNIFWAGFCEDKLSNTLDRYNGFCMPAIYKRKLDAKKCFGDVRKVRVVEERKEK